MICVQTYNEFGNAFSSIQKKQAPLKTKMLRHNNSAFVTKELRKAITKRRRLKSLFNKK